MDIYFCSFADSRMSACLSRIKEQALAFDMFKEVYVIDENGLDSSFRDHYKDKLILGSRGYGYWMWKPYLLQRMLDYVADGDIIIYADAGCHLNANGKQRLCTYIDVLVKNEAGLLLFSQEGLLERCWTKGDVFDYFGVRHDMTISDSAQRAGTVLFIQKKSTSENIIREWNQAYESDFSLIDDTPSHSPNLDGFVEHRHDQSILSILSKLRGAAFLPVSEIYAQDWDTISDHPILAKRDKKLKLFYLLSRKYHTACRILRKLF